MTVVIDFTCLRMSDYIIIWAYGDSVEQIIKDYNDEGFQNAFVIYFALAASFRDCDEHIDMLCWGL